MMGLLLHIVRGRRGVARNRALLRNGVGSEFLGSSEFLGFLGRGTPRNPEELEEKSGEDP